MKITIIINPLVKHLIIESDEKHTQCEVNLHIEKLIEKVDVNTHASLSDSLTSELQEYGLQLLQNLLLKHLSLAAKTFEEDFQKQLALKQLQNTEHH